MRKVSLEELGQIVADSREDVWSVAGGYERQPKIYLHWSAGRYDTVFDDYHINITGDGDIIVTTEDMSEVKYHTYMRNAGAIGISLCCCYGATSNDLDACGYAPTAKQIETMAQVITVVADALWLTIDMKHVMTHGEAADNADGWYAHEPYGPNNGVERWDLQYLGTNESPAYVRDYDDPAAGGNVLRGKAIWYKEQNDKE